MGNNDANKIVFPGKTWEKRSYKDFGINSDALDKITEIMKITKANGVLICNGYLVKEWTFGGASKQRYDVQSCTKPIVSLLLGLSIKEGKILSIDSKVKTLWTDFNVGPYTDQITFRHLATATSGIKSVNCSSNYVDPNNMTPGVECRYHNDHCYQLACALTYIWKEDLEKVLRTYILNKINADMKWHHIKFPNGSNEKVVAGFAYSRWTARDLARVGFLYLNKGVWKKEQLLPEAYVKRCMTPIPLPVKEWRKKGKPRSEKELSRLAYSLAWRGRRVNGKRILWYMSGNGGQFCVLIPERNIVMVKINNFNNRPKIGIEAFEKALLSL